jgi:hypothetical protein
MLSQKIISSISYRMSSYFIKRGQWYILFYYFKNIPLASHKTQYSIRNEIFHFCVTLLSLTDICEKRCNFSFQKFFPIFIFSILLSTVKPVLTTTSE